MTEKIIIAGFGGQGVLSMGQFIAYAAMYDDLYVSWLPSYGPEMRGGTSNCSVIISDQPVSAPVISTPDYLIAMNLPSLDKFMNRVAPGGHILVNSSLIDKKVERQDVTVHYIPVNQIAAEVGNPKTANIVMFGAFLATSGNMTSDSINKAVEYVFSSKPQFIEINKLALQAGMKAIQK